MRDDHQAPMFGIRNGCGASIIVWAIIFVVAAAVFHWWRGW